jgi:branched-chain amino acid transport system ATP-binding protein
MILRTDGLTRDFGSLRAVNNVSLDLPDGQIRAIIGPNGAGKTTLLDLITNRTPASAGHVYFRDKEITWAPSYTIVRMGIGKCFQVSKLFPALTAFENIQIACISKGKKTFNMVSSGKKVLADEVQGILESIGLASMTGETAGYLSYGDQRRLEIGITLGLHPSLLLLDEPTAGVSRSEGNEVMLLIKRLAAERGLTILFIEHDMDIVFNYADEITVMHQGAVIASDTPARIKDNKLVQDTYLGEKIV